MATWNVERMSAEMQKFVLCIESERRSEQDLAKARSETGEALMRLEAAAAQNGINPIDLRFRLKEEARRLQVELTEGAMRNRKRMAVFRRNHPPLISAACLTLGVSRQRAIANLPAGRLQEFVHQGVPTYASGTKQLNQATAREVVQAVKASRGVPAWEPIPMEKLILTPAKRSRSQLLDLAKAMLRKAGSLTLEEAEDFLLLLMTLFAIAPRGTTRRLMEWTNSSSEPADIDQVLDTLDALPELWERVEVSSQAARLQMADRACSKVARLLLAICTWRKVEREAG